MKEAFHEAALDVISKVLRETAIEHIDDQILSLLQPSFLLLSCFPV